MTEQEHTINVSLEWLHYQIESNLNHAKAALTTENPKFCQMGLVALAKALTLAELVDDNREQLSGRDVAVFAEYGRQTVKLLNAFWKDFGLVLLQRTQVDEQGHKEPPIVVHAQERPARPVMPRPRPQPKEHWDEKPNGNGKHGDASRTQNKIDPWAKQHVLENLTPPAGVGKLEWFRQLSEEYGINAGTIQTWDYNRRHKNGDGEAQPN